MAEPACNGCRACCIDDLQAILPGEVGRYHTELFQGIPVLKHKPNGECFYLGPNGCTIHEWKPTKCKELTCWELLAQIGEKQMERFAGAAVTAAAKARTKVKA